MKKILLLFIVAMVPSLFIMGCSGTDDLLTTKQNVDVTLDSFQLTYNPAAPLLAANATLNNPSCGAVAVNLDNLLAGNPEWADLADRIKEIKIEKVQYMVTGNTTAVDITGKLQLTDPVTGLLTDIGEVIIPASTDINTWTELPFAPNGANIVNYYLSNRDVSFDYCAEGSPNESSLSMTLEIQLGAEVTVRIL